MNDLTQRALAAAINDLEDALDHVMRDRDSITLPQYRRLKALRFRFADFLVASIRNEVEPQGDKS